jgi:hypothetical protein
MQQLRLIFFYKSTYQAVHTFVLLIVLLFITVELFTKKAKPVSLKLATRGFSQDLSFILVILFELCCTHEVIENILLRSRRSLSVIFREKVCWGCKTLIFSLYSIEPLKCGLQSTKVG